MGNESPKSAGPTRFLVWLAAASGLVLAVLAPESIFAHDGEVHGGPKTEALAETVEPMETLPETEVHEHPATAPTQVVEAPPSHHERVMTAHRWTGTGATLVGATGFLGGSLIYGLGHYVW